MVKIEVNEKNNLPTKHYMSVHTEYLNEKKEWEITK